MNKEKYLQVFNYLLEFSKIRSVPVRDIQSSEAYSEIIWFADIPQYDIFDCITFSNYNQDADYWLKISKPKNEPHHPRFPILSKTLTEWIDEESLIDENGTPILKETITKSGKLISIIEYPEIEKEFQTYLNDKWIDDVEFYNKELEDYKIKLAEYEKQSKTYKQFFSIYNKAQQFGEEFELIVGVGLLNFREDGKSHLICRHILTSKVEITFNSSIKVLPSIENEIKIETDAILDLIEQFDSSDVIEAETKVSNYLKEHNITGNPFDLKIIDAIQIFADRMRTDGELSNELTKPREVTKKPTIYFAPALILRKRNTRSFSALYQKIISDIENSDDSINIPSINDIIDINDLGETFSNDANDEISYELTDETIYFPKPYNDEQIEIIEKARRNNKVLVQGPPGTGKSHTIANLICHLLANGEKVLVTAYTKRALEVLKDKLPDDFKNLTVNLLSGDSSSLQDLNSSVNAINDELSRITNLSRYKKEIEEKETELSLVKEEKAYTKNKWLNIKEKSTRQLTINRKYQGTLTEIAERIEKELSCFAWYKDKFNNIDKIDLISDIENFYNLTSYYRNINCNDFNYKIPQKDKILTLSELKEYSKIKSELTQKYTNEEGHFSINCKNYVELKIQLQELHKLCSKIENNALSFKLKLLNDYWNNLKFWKDKITNTAKILADLPEEKLKQFDRSVEIQYPNEKSLIQLKSDAQTLLSYMKEGNALSGILFNLKKALLPKNIKDKLYFIDEVKVNGSICITESEFQTVLLDIKTKQDFEELETIWGIKVNGIQKSYFDKVKFYRQLKEDTEDFIILLDEANKLKTQIEETSSIKIKDYESLKVNNLIADVEYNYIIDKAKAFKARINDAKNHLTIINIHPFAKTIVTDIDNIAVFNYEQHLSEIDILNSEKEKYRNYKNLQSNHQEHFPILIKEILENTFEFSNLSQFENAILHKHAYSEIIKLLTDNYEKVLIQQIFNLEFKEKELISTIASRKAWLHIVERLSTNPKMQQHLTAWKQAVRVIPKTRTSPNYNHYRKIANKEMEYCKQSVACWVMPLYQVVENFIPEPAMFDYVIIDEASQLGPDAVFLFYISKNIIVVGDDKQTAPEYVGVDDGMVKTLIHKHLKPTPTQEIPYADFYGTKHSFFDHCDRLCAGKRIVLREHFRCMPEIIEFSNKHFYAPDGKGLYPLKQYSEKRLNPLETFYCQNGYTDGSYSNIINKVEAEEIAKKIAEIIKDENYFKIEDGVKKPKTIGVITLQGNSQSKIIESRLMDLIGSDEMKNRKITCGNSASFQGDERDIIFLSMVVAQNHRGNALTRAEDERRFNVAVSRALEQIWLFHSLQLEDLQSKSSGIVDLRFKLLDHFKNYKENKKVSSEKIDRKLGNQPTPFESWFEVDVHNDIIDKGYDVIPQYPVVKGKHRIDLAVVLSNGVKIAVECDGDDWHGPDQAWADAGRQGFLERIGGWQFFRVRGGEYYSNRKKSLEPLWELLRANETQKDDPIIPIKNDLIEQEKPKIDIVEKIKYEIKREPIKNFSKVEQVDLFQKESQVTMDFIQEETSDIIRYFNLYKTGIYIMTNDNPLDADNVLPIKANQKNGFLLQCYDNGHINKVFISYLLSRKIGKEYMNGLNSESKLIYFDIIESEKVIGLYFNEDGTKKFKAHLTENISIREQLHLQGIKVIYNDYDNLEYKIYPIDINNDISRLVFHSFTANGKPIDNNYYEKEWMILKKYSAGNTITKVITKDEQLNELKESKVEINFDKIVNKNSTVKVRINNDKEIIVHLIETQTNVHVITEGIQKIFNHSPLAVSIIGKTKGDKVKIGNTNNSVEIIEIIN